MYDRGLYTVTVPQDFQQKVEERLQKKEEFKNRRLNKDHPKYSIITPLYNSFDLMGRYFKSLDNQTIKHFEVIIVDDCSSDGSYEKAKEYAEKSSLDISVYKSDSNKGPGNARNIGMDNAKGEYITFIDNDDWVDTEFLEKVDEIIEQEKVNCVIYDYYTTDGKEKKTQHSMYDVEGGRVSLTNCMTSVRNHTFGKFYKLTKCKGIRYPELRRCEDVAFVCRAIDACGSVYYLKEPLYYYYQRPTSLSNNTNLDESDMIKAFDILEKTLGDRYPNELKEKSVADLLYGCTLMMCKSGKSDKEIKAYIDRYENKYPEWWTYSSVNRLGKAKKFFLDAAKYRNVFAMKQMAALHSKIIGGGYEEESPLISVIVPVYNVELYLKRCVNSITSQSYGILEIILVDDGSTDNSGIICEQIADKDARVRVIHKKNGGLSSARNTGLENASGEYVAFVDSDDWIDIDIYKKCIVKVDEYKCDVVDFRIVYSNEIRSDGLIQSSETKEKPIIVEEKDIPYDYLYRGQTETSPFSVCRKMYRANLYHGISFPVGKVNEDIATNYRVLLKAHRLIHISDVGYYYFQDNESSITSGVLRKKDFDLIDASRMLCELAKQSGDSRVYALAKVKLGRSYFSLLAKAAIGGIGEDISEQDIKYLTCNLRNNYGMLMRSPMPVNRKVLTTFACINYKTIEKPYRLLKKVRAS